MKTLREDNIRASGLRERRRARTRAAIRQQALRLFREQGYRETTVEQVAAAAEVSYATFFRYFPTKEDVVLDDALGPGLLEAYRAQPPELSSIQAMRRAVRAVYNDLPYQELEQRRERATLVLSVPELRAAAVDRLARTGQVLTEVVAERVGRAADDFAVRTFVGAVVGVLVAAMLSGSRDPWADLFGLMDVGLEYLEAGLPL
jgi:AcrR family transcriptional regulator